MTNEYNAVEKLHTDTIIKEASNRNESFMNASMATSYTSVHASVTKDVAVSFNVWTRTQTYWHYSEMHNCWIGDLRETLSDSELYDLYITKHLNK